MGLTVAVTGPTGTFGFALMPLLQADERWKAFLPKLQPLIHTQRTRMLLPTSYSPVR